ncbi:hypothetical protein LCGC14_1458130 [marine sediment metagenome]|uniref:Uncharacterized protein n=1 Tax=marine sediment metagenome TaxID=412755 RepID=A0A0F9JFU9_9ZZZZ
MKRKCKECGKRKKSIEFRLIEMDMVKQRQGLILTHQFKDICNDCIRTTKEG